MEIQEIWRCKRDLSEILWRCAACPQRSCHVRLDNLQAQLIQLEVCSRAARRCRLRPGRPARLVGWAGQGSELQGQPVRQSRRQSWFKFTRVMVTGLGSQCQADSSSLNVEALSALRAGFRKITILTCLPVLKMLTSANGCQLSLGHCEPFFAG